MRKREHRGLSVRVAMVTALCAVTILSLGASQLRLRIRQVGSSPGANNPIAASRQPGANTSVPNTVWAASGLESGYGTGLSRCTTGTGTSIISAYTGTAATINTAITGCDSGHYVELGSGTFTLSTAVILGSNGVSLRGQGADSTILKINGDTSGCGLFYAEVVRMCTGTAGGHLGTTDGGGPGPDHSASWTAGYTQGTTSITLSSTTGLAVGSTIVLDQVNDTSDAGDLFYCDHSGSGAQPCSYEGGGSYYRTQLDRSQVEFHTVTAINGSTVTIDPGVYAPNFVSGKTPGAWWGDASAILTGAGLDDVTVDWTGNGSAVGVLVMNCTNCWVRGSRLIYNGGAGSFLMHLLSIQTMHNTYSGNYIYGPNQPPSITNYAYSIMNASLNRFENNILDNNITAIAPDDPETANVVGYNFVVNAAGYAVPGFQPHQPGDTMQLWEGNDLGGFLNDVIHGTHFFGTLHRNYLNGQTNSPTSNCAETCSGITLETYSRFFNLLGNVLSSADFTTYQSTTTSQFPAEKDSTVFLIGWRGTHGPSLCSPCPDSVGGGNDPDVLRTLFRWGNWDNVTSTSDNTSNDQTGTRWNTGEVPSGITNYANAVPGAQSLPASLYLAAKPSWFGTRPFPLIGPDVVNASPIANTGAHVYKIPARYRYENGTNDAGYPTSSPRIKSGVTCGIASCATP